MKKNILILSFVLLFQSCNSQEKQNKLYEKQESMEKEILSEYAKENGIKSISDEDFKEKCIQYLGINTDNGQDDYIFFMNDEYAICVSKHYLKTFSESLFYNPSIQGNVSREQAKATLKEGGMGKKFITYNKVLFNDDIASITQILQDKQSVQDLVIYFDYEKNPMLLKFAVKDINCDQRDKDFDYLEHIIFYNNRKGENVIRKDLLKMFADNDLDNLISLSYSVLYDTKNYRGISQKNKEVALAYMLEIILEKADPIEDFEENKSYRLLNNVYVEDNNILNEFQKEHYYDYKYLKTYSEIYLLSLNNDNDDSSKTYTIHDPDGYTNLRKEKHTQSEVLQKIKSGESVAVLNNSGDWWQVKTKEGKTGYVHKSRIKSGE